MQLSPRQSPQAVAHFCPFLRQVHKLLPHGFLDDSLHLHRTNFSKPSGAESKSSLLALVPYRQASNPNAYGPVHCF